MHLNVMIYNIIMSFLLLHWNARSLIANGQEFKKYIADMNKSPDIICIQETWLCKSLDFKMNGYEVIRKDRINGRGGGCATFIKENVIYRQINNEGNIESICIELMGTQGVIRVLNFYNPCSELTIDILKSAMGEKANKMIICGDFNAHNCIWGSKSTDKNGEIIEEFMEDNSLVCLNDGNPTRIDIARGGMSCLDVTVVSASLAGKCMWSVSKDNIGSDHFPVTCISK